MNKKILYFIPVFLFCYISSAFAADTLLSFPIDKAMQNGEVMSALRKNIALYWGEQPTPAVIQNFGNFKTSKRTNGFTKPKQEACEWALASALVALQDRALREGANAVINIKSNINNNPKSSQTQFDCLAGTVMVNVALTGNVVKLAR